MSQTFFKSQLDVAHQLKLPQHADFLVDGKYVFEIGGKNKPVKQIRDLAVAFIVMDDIENGAFNQIPLWIFGFLY